MNTIVIYHGGCRDGFCAAWVVNKYLEGKDHRDDPPVMYFPGYYGQEPPDVTGKDVIIVDFCYSPIVMEQILSECSSLIWIDHHKTAIPVFDIFSQFIGGATALKVKFSLEKSGAGLAWDYFFPNEPRPWLVDYVEDRDLWLHKLDRSEIVNAYISALEFNFDVWNKVNTNIEPPFEYGSVVMMKTEQYVREVCKNVYFADLILNNDGRYQDNKIHQSGSFPSDVYPKEMYTWEKGIPIVNICQIDCSEVLHELCKRFPESPFTLYWFKRQDGMYQYGLRSIGDFDVSAVAKLFGGGGHRNAAGFQLSYLLEELK